jgi:putative membrane protein
MMCGFGGWIGWLFMATWWLLAAVAVVWLVVAVRARSTDGGGSAARRVLDERFAAGEVTVEEYRERRAVLEQR